MIEPALGGVEVPLIRSRGDGVSRCCASSRPGPIRSARLSNRLTETAETRPHRYFIGKTRTGKSTLIASLSHQDLIHGEGFALLDPHGDLVGQVLRSVPEGRQGVLIYFYFSDTTHPLTFNPLETAGAAFRPLVAS